MSRAPLDPPPVDRGSPPPPGPLRPFHPPGVLREVDPGTGFRILRAPHPRSPLVSVVLVLDAGEERVEASRGGLAHLAASALECGTARRSGLDLALAFEELGTGLSTEVGWDATTLAFTVQADRLEAALDLLGEVVREPAFPEGEVERIRAARLATIAQRAADPSALADDSAARWFHAEGSLYGRPGGGTRGSIRGLQAADLEEFSSTRWNPASAGIVLAGDFDLPASRSALERAFAGWAPRPRPEAPPASPARPSSPRVIVIDRPGAVQSELRIGHAGVARSTPDFFSLRVFNSVLGGSFTSRLNLNLRERHGFTYGVRSGFAMRRRGGPFSIATAVGIDQTAPAIREALLEVRTLLEEGPTPFEVESARDYLAGVFPLGFERTGAVATRVADLLVHDLPDDTLTHWRDRLRAVSPEEAGEAGRRHVRPEEFTILVVGDARRIRPALEELDEGAVHTVAPGAGEES